MSYIIGIDEAGRGSLAGPIVAGAILSQGTREQVKILKLVKDSKQLLSQRREELYKLIIANFEWAIQAIDNQQIDKFGIQQANYKIFARALDKIKPSTESIVVLGDYVGGGRRILPHINFYKKGDQRFSEISAASIIAKVYRDNVMRDFHKLYPEYNFEQHKGYGTLEHRQKIKKFGLCQIHRLTFLKNIM